MPGFLGIPIRALPCQGAGVEGFAGKTLFGDDRQGEFVIREGGHEGLVRESCPLQDCPEGFPTEGRHLLPAVAAFNAIHRHPYVVFGKAGQVLEAQLVFNGHNQFAPRFEQITGFEQHMQGRIFPFGEQGGVLEYADERDDIKPQGKRQILKPVGEHGDIRQVSGPRPGNGCPSGGPFEGQHMGATFAQESGDGSASGTNFQHSSVRKCFREGSQNVRAVAGEVIQRCPVSDASGQFD